MDGVRGGTITRRLRRTGVLTLARRVGTGLVDNAIGMLKRERVDMHSGDTITRRLSLHCTGEC